MFKSKTLFIVGAGASQEAGLPTGTELKTAIAKKLDIRYAPGNPYVPVSGDPAIAREISEYAQRSNLNMNIILHDAWKIRDAMPQAISIDNFIDAHNTSPGVVLTGKLGIAQAIIEAEKNGRLYLEPIPGQDQKFDHTKIPGSWYLPFFQLLTENIRKEDASTLFTNVSFVTFNYDRCIEHYIYHAIQNYYGIQDIPQLMQNLKISHPYGVVGALPWQNPRTHVSFGGLLRNANLIAVANEIRTFTERMQGNDPALASIRQQVQEAETIVFLGFGYADLNMELLSLEKTGSVGRVFGTAKGVSDIDVKTIIIPETARMLRMSNHGSIHINNKLTCYELFGEYWHTLSRA
jgi:hypothetical protein